MKNALSEHVLPVAQKMRKLTLGTSTKLIINDYPEIAALTGADGVHIGQTDMPYSAVRAIVGDSSIIGISTHSPNQAAEACRLEPDYIGVGPVFPTPTKVIPDPVLGISTMHSMISRATVPAVAIGGISLETLPDVIRGGARNFCMVRPINSAQEPERILKAILKTYAATLRELT
jgi:thiamine-phosphate pyrophosphorylase